MTLARTAQRSHGKVVLVGAGPGAPDLLTLRAAHALAEADLVLYDALVDKSVLELAPKAAKFSVGKRSGRASVTQDTIHALMVREAKKRKLVVRLKCGDPFVLGRGGEEVLALGEAGVEVEVIPGVSSAIAGPGAAGIPVTLRGYASGFLVLTAVPEDKCLAVLARQDPNLISCVLLMALGARRTIVDGLARAGWRADTPAAVVLGAHGPRSYSWVGTLETLADFEVPPGREDLPGLVVLGAVVRAAEPIRKTLLGDRASERGCESEVRLGSA
jgi:uroporphyrin-III C-methyltransferase